MNFHVPLPPSGILFGGDLSKDFLGQVAKLVAPLGYNIYVTNENTKSYLTEYLPQDAKVQIIEFPKNDKRKLRELFQEHDINCLLYTSRCV